MEPLTEKYRPRKVEDFTGLDRPKKILGRLLAHPRNCSLCFIGPPGIGKTTLGMAFASELDAGLIHVRAQKCNVESIEQVWFDVQYFPPDGKQWWVVLIDEADQMSRPAQLALLSHLDSTANLAFDFGGSTRETAPIPVIWIFTSNGTGYDGTAAPAGFEARFLSRCLQIPFEPKSVRAGLPAFLQDIWNREGGDALPLSAFERLVIDKSASPRDCLQALELGLLSGELAGYGKEETADGEREAGITPDPELDPIPEPSREPSNLFEILRQQEKAFWRQRA